MYQACAFSVEDAAVPSSDETQNHGNRNISVYVVFNKQANSMHVLYNLPASHAECWLREGDLAELLCLGALHKLCHNNLPSCLVFLKH